MLPAFYSIYDLAMRSDSIGEFLLREAARPPEPADFLADDHSDLG
jgi:hypothetical protein